MKITDYLDRQQTLFSLEFFPPKNAAGHRRLAQTLATLQQYTPHFVSVTYGAGGSTRAGTLELVRRCQEQGYLTMPHLTGIGTRQAEMQAILQRYQQMGIENLLLLRGDLPQSGCSPEGDFAHASDLLDFVNTHYDFCTAAAVYPEVHPQAASLLAEVTYAQLKVQAGARFLITQCFYDNRHYFALQAQMAAQGLEVPILAGILPITRFTQITRFILPCGATLPEELWQAMQAVQDDPQAVYRLGLQHAITQCQELLRQGVAGIHIYTLNRPQAASEILAALR